MSSNRIAWINIHGQPPKPHHTVLITRETNGGRILSYGYLDANKNWFDQRWNLIVVDVIAWAEFPEPWEGEW